MVKRRRIEKDGTRNETKTVKRYEIEECIPSQFEKDEYEKKYFQRFKEKGVAIYCIKDPKREISVYGTRNDDYKHRDESYIIIQVEKCHEKSRVKGDPKCSSD